tara:strand:- start:659 stop:1423 length:765 start_codon:yes stop_codon:yes gene_type:complete
MGNSDWWKPQSLKISEKKFRNKNELDQVDVHNDFGSYKVMLKTNDATKSIISTHNELTPSYRVKAIKGILGGFVPEKIYDLGCGLGFTTNEISREYPCADVIGMDISEDAIAFGKKNFSSCQFLCEAVDPERKDQVFCADLIYAFEFYPFSRTSDLNDHKQYLAHLTDELSENGKLVIFQLWNNPESLSANYSKLAALFPNLQFALYSMPLRQIGRFVRFRILANILSVIARLVLRSISNRQLGENKVLVISKK